MHCYIETDHRGLIQSIISDKIDDSRPTFIELAKKDKLFTLAIRQDQDHDSSDEQQSQAGT